MKKSFALITGLIVAGVVGTSAIGDGHSNKAALDATKARQAQMQLYSFNLGILGAMAKGDVEYNAEAASAAASNLAALSQMNQSAMWIPGSDSDTLGDATRALPAIWTADSKIGERGMAFGTAAVAMETAAGGGLDSLRGAIGDVGKSCGACHDDYRKPK